MNLQELTARRDVLYRRTAELRLRTLEEAIAFVEQRGFIYFWPIAGLELPNLWQAVAGQRPVPAEHDDPGHITWGWKDDMLDKKRWYYGKLLKGRGTLVALDTLPYFYALSENYGSPDDYLQEYEAGTLTSEARQLLEALIAHGPLDTLALRREAGLTSTDSKGRFDKALVSLQTGLKILPTGVTQSGRWKYAYRYDLVTRWFPDLAEQSRAIGRGQAREMVLRRYLENVVAATAEQTVRLFNWSRADVDKTLDRLAGSGEVVLNQSIEGLAGQYAVWRRIVSKP